MIRGLNSFLKLPENSELADMIAKIQSLQMQFNESKAKAQET